MARESFCFKTKKIKKNALTTKPFHEDHDNRGKKRFVGGSIRADRFGRWWGCPVLKRSVTTNTYRSA
jgi:hypothetical protein